jgi:hypothetical protein
MRCLALTCALLLCAPCAARAAEIKVLPQADGKPTIITVNGHFDTEDAQRFVEATKKIDKAIVYFDSRGGVTLVGLNIGRRIRAQGF